MLQAFALKNHLTYRGHEVSVIDFLLPEMVNNNRQVKWSKNFKILVRSSLALPYLPTLRQRFEKFETFKTETMNLTRRYSSFIELQKNPPLADVYICGSDQIWNPERCLNPAFMLNFGNSSVKRISYAASLGVDHASQEKLEELGKYLECFSSVSVREKSGAKLVEKAGRKAEVVVDPSLLLDRSQWEKEAIPFAGTGKYILTYCLEESEEFNSVLKKVADKTGLSVIRIGGAIKNRIQPVDRFIRNAGPREFLGLLLNAEYIHTNSFHGTAFALNFGIPLVGIRHSRRNARMTTLLDSLGWSDSQVGASNSVDEILDIANSRATKIDGDCLAKAKEDSIKFLERNIC